jgi:hypothetical protein
MCKVLLKNKAILDEASERLFLRMEDDLAKHPIGRVSLLFCTQAQENVGDPTRRT